jgi:uncharacterized protein YabN with tetrapyrrole methylase and pyrophosphatase domain
MRTTSIYLLGSGIRGTLHFTTETVQAIKACRVVHVLHADPDVLRFVQDLGVEARDLASQYQGETVRDDVYRKVAQVLVDSVSAAGGPVALLVHGNPFFLVSAAEYTLELAEARGLRVSVVPALSSFDTLLCDLKIDYGYAVQMYDTTTLLNSGWVPNPHVPLLLFQLSSTLDQSVIIGDPCPGGLLELQNLLSPLYGIDHEVDVVHSAAHAMEGSSVTRISLSKLASSPLDLWRRPTLHVPPVQS